MRPANLCQPCYNRRREIVSRHAGYTRGSRCDGCRRLTKTAPCYPVYQPTEVRNHAHAVSNV